MLYIRKYTIHIANDVLSRGIVILRCLMYSQVEEVMYCRDALRDLGRSFAKIDGSLTPFVLSILNLPINPC